MILWAKGKSLAWNVAVPETFTISYTSKTLAEDDLMAKQEMTSETNKYIDSPTFSTKSSLRLGSLDVQALELIKEIIRHNSGLEGRLDRDDLPISENIHVHSEGQCTIFFHKFLNDND